jgi:hypothetical protein
MARTAQNVYTGQHDIAMLEARAAQLPDEAKVEVLLVQGHRVTGVVTTRPIIQLFYDEDGREGFNGVLRIDDARDAGQTHFLWLDEILEVVVLGTA